MSKWQGQFLSWYISVALLIVGLTSLFMQAKGEPTGHVQQYQFRMPEILSYEYFSDKFHKSSVTSGAVKLVNRFRLFIARTIAIFKHNIRFLNKSVSYYLEQNAFTDLTSDELKEKFVSYDDDLTTVSDVHIFKSDEYMQQLSHESDGDPYAGYSRTTQTDIAGGSQEPKVMNQDSVDFLQDLELDEQYLSNIPMDNQQSSDLAPQLTRIRDNDVRKAELDQAARQELDERERQGIVLSANVMSNDKNYDSSSVPSPGLISSVYRYCFGSKDCQERDDTHEDEYEYEYEDEDEYEYEDEDEDEDEYEDEDEDEDEDEYEDEDDEFSQHESSFFPSLLRKVGFFNVFNSDTTEQPKSGNELSQSSLAQCEDGKSGCNKIHMQKKNEPEVLKETQIVFDIDWRLTGCVSRPKNQRECNSCYAFSTLDLMEYYYCRQLKISTEFSAQYIIDCGYKAGLDQCKGGALTNVGRFIRDYGLHLNSTFPYLGGLNSCPLDATNDSRKESIAIKPLIQIWQKFDRIEVGSKWFPKTPILVGINMPSDFFVYGGGIHDGFDCVPGMGHSMLLVGSGKQDGKPFWLLKNSLSSDWGEGGYFRLSKRAPRECYRVIIVVRAKFNFTIA